MKKLLPFLFFAFILNQAARSQACFTVTSYTPGATVMSVDTADFNGDTFLDIVTTSHGPSNSVNVFFGDGAGNFTVGPVITGFGLPPRYVASGDIDGDGDMDLMVTHNNGNNYSKVFNTGGGVFGAPTGVICTAGSHIIINGGDLDNDGDVDFVYSMNSAGVVLRNNGSGTFTESNVGKSYDGYGIAVGDLNNDNKPDLITIKHSDSVGVTLNTNITPGVMSFSTITTSYYKGSTGSFDLRFVTCRDLNGDGFRDVISSAGSSGRMAVFMGDGTGALGAPTVYTVGGAYNSDVADFDQDGKLDIVISSGASYKIFYGDGTGAFPSMKSYATTASFAGLRVGDFNEDGMMDLATAGGTANTQAAIYMSIVRPPAPVGTTDPAYCPGATASPLTATGTNLLWYTVATGGTGNGTAITPSTASSGTINYYVSQNPTGTCESPRDTIAVLVHPGMSSSFSNLSFCVNTIDTIPFSFTGGTAPYTYNWYPFSGSSFSTSDPYTIDTITTTNSYTVDVIDANGCMTSNVTVASPTTSTDLYGVISSSTLGLINPGNVYAFQYLPNNSGFDTVAVVPTNALGEYTFPALTAGDYLIKAIADTLIYPTAVPTYYGDEFQWDSSVVFNHVCSQIDTADIEVIELAGGTGTGFISGFVIEGPGYDQRLMNPQLNPFLVPGGPLKGIDVKLGKNPSAGIQARTFTDTNGYYAFNNLPDGDYKIYVDIPNLPMDSLREVSLVTGNNTSTQNNYFADSVHIYINPDTITFVGLRDVQSSTALVVKAFPNPARNLIHITVEAEQAGSFYCELIDLTGKKTAATLPQEMQKGENTFTVGLGTIAKGVYTLNTYVNNSRTTLKVVIIE